MDMSACNTCVKSVKDRNSIKCNLCLTKVHLKYSYLSYVDSQYIKFLKKAWHCRNCSKDLLLFTVNNFRPIRCLVAESIVIVIQMNHA